MAKKKVRKSTARVAKVKVNKSQAIRDYRAKHADAGPTEIAKALNAQGIKVTPPQVSNALSTSAKKKGPKKSSQRKAVTRRASEGSVTVNDLVAAKQFAEKVGGVDSAKDLLKAIERLGN